MSTTDGQPTTEDTTFVARTITKLKVRFVTAVTVKQQRVLLQQGNWECGDGQHMECEVVTGSGQSVQCELLTGIGQTVECEVLTESGQTVHCEVLTVDRLYSVRY